MRLPDHRADTVWRVDKEAALACQRCLAYFFDVAGFEAEAEPRGGFAVAEETEGSEVVEVALASAFGYRTNVVGIPEAAAGGDGLHAIEPEARGSGWASGSLESVPSGDGIDLADSADASVAGEDMVAEIARVGSETPLMDAVVGAEGAAAFGEDFEIAPAAEREVVGTFG
jgi:hypothetical protein